MFRNGEDLGTGESCIPVVFFDPLLQRSPCFPDVDFAVLARNPVDYAISSLAGWTVSFGCTKSDRNVMSDLKTVRIPSCSRQ